jgi:hypothetical protein
VVHFQCDFIFTIVIILHLQVSSFKVTLSKVVLNGLGSYSLPNVGVKLCCFQNISPWIDPPLVVEELSVDFLKFLLECSLLALIELRS